MHSGASARRLPPSDSSQTHSSSPSLRARVQAQVISHYRDRRFDGNQEQFEERLRTSTTVYVGNLSFFTTEDQIYEARAGAAGPAAPAALRAGSMRGGMGRG